MFSWYDRNSPSVALVYIINKQPRWDCTLALLSRTPCVFPTRYYDYVLACDDENDSWDMFSLSGVPKNLFSHLVELVQLANEKEKTAQMRWATFNMDRVFELEESILEYSHRDMKPPLTEASEEAIQHWHDCCSGVDAWKYALLLYIARVFKWERKSSIRPVGMSSLARLTLDNVRCCRNTSMVQKQLLLPVFLAGSESDDSYSRMYVQEYCEHWFHRCRYRMFRDASALMTEIWAARDGGNRDARAWWGSITDEKSRETEDADSGRLQEYLLG